MASVAYHTESFLANHSRFVRLGSPLNISRPDAQVSLYPNVYKEKGFQARVLVVPKALVALLHITAILQLQRAGGVTNRTLLIG